MNETMSSRQKGEYCPACERFIGADDTCPYCDSDSAVLLNRRNFRIISLLLAITGLIFLYLMAANRDVPVIKTGDITPVMNFARVRVKGMVCGKAYISRRSNHVDYVSFTVDDGSGGIRVQAFRRIADQIAGRALIPQDGMAVEVTGSLNVNAGGDIKLRLDSPENLILDGRLEQ